MDAQSVTPSQHFTEPPKRYTEATLIKKLEEDGIGRPSTYAMIIDTIQQRGYVTLAPVAEKSRTKFFTPTEQGELTTEKLDQYFSSIINVSYTKDMETELDEIAEGKREEVPTLRSFYDKFTPLLEVAYDKMEKIAPEKVGEICPECGGELVYRNSRYGKFISCSNFPQCKYTRSLENKEKEKPEPTGKMCPECGSELLKRKSRFGTYFLGCSAFPKCRYMENLEGERIVSKKDKEKTSSTKKTTKKTAAKKSTLDSLAYQTRDVLDAMAKTCQVSIPRLRVDGGACANNYLMHKQADIMQCSIIRPSVLESTALGAARLAALAINYWTMDDIRKQDSEDTIFEPSICKEEADAMYDRWQKAVSAARMFTK